MSPTAGIGGPPFAHLAARDATIDLWNEEAIAALPRHFREAPLDVIATSPPYNLAQPYGVYDDRRPRAEYLAWIRAFAKAVDRSLSARGSFFLNVGAPPRDPTLAWDVAGIVGERFALQNVVHWIKSVAIDRRFTGRASGVVRDLALGHYKPLRSERFVHGAHEYVLHFSRSGDVPLDRLAIGVAYQDPSNERRWRRAASRLRCRGNTWFLPYSTIQRRAVDRPHPATFPPELPEWCVRLHGLGRVARWADPFVGIGSSAVAAVRLGREFHGFDIDPGYLAVARQRVEREIARAAPAPTTTASRPRRRRRRAGSTPSSGAS